MSQNRELLTQGELAALTEQLTTLVDNVTEHANAPLDKAHGLNLVRADVVAGPEAGAGYFDSGGDRLTLASPNNFLLRVTAGPTHLIYYVPAILAGSEDMPPNADLPALIKSISGVPPLDRALITEYTQALEDEARIHNMVLFEHAKAITSSSAPKAHGQIFAVLSGTDQPDARDELGHSLGRHVVRIQIGDKIYRIPCDVRKQGPKQGVRKLSNGEPSESEMSAAPAGQGNGSVTSTFRVRGECPIRFRWRAGTSANSLTTLFTDSNFDGNWSNDFFGSVSNARGGLAQKQGNSLMWTFQTPTVVGQRGDEVVGTVSCTITSNPHGTDGGNTYGNDLVLCCDAKAGDDADYVTSRLVYYSAYDETDGC